MERREEKRRDTMTGKERRKENNRGGVRGGEKREKARETRRVEKKEINEESFGEERKIREIGRDERI